jgi:hypothetical protein
MKEKVVIKDLKTGEVEEYWIGKKPRKENPLNKTYLSERELDNYMMTGIDKE